MRLVEKRVLSTALSTRQPRVLKQVGKPPPCVKGVGALQPARVVGEGSGPGQELQRRDHPRCEGVTETVAAVTLEFPPTRDAGRRGATQRALWTIQRAGCMDSIPLNCDVTHLTSRKPERMAAKNGRPESRPRLSPTRQFFRLRITADKKRLCGAPGGEDTVDAGHSDVELCRDSLAGLEALKNA